MKRAIDPDVRLLQAAADPTRLAILRQLSGADAVCACDFTSCCDVAQPTVSHHLKVLREAGWVRTTRRGSWVFYAIDPDALARFRAIAGTLVASNAVAGGLLGGATGAGTGGPGAGRALPVIQPRA